jgi:hypothetical protein
MSNDNPFSTIPLTVASESMSFPRLDPSLATEGTVIWKLWLAICPTTVATPFAKEVFG